MKIFISADIEGVTGIADWDETTKASPCYHYFRDQMTKEVVSVAEGAVQAGATEILVKDAHSTGRNIDPGALPQCARILRGWSGHPFSMVAGLDDSFDAVLYVGYHSRAGSEGNPLAHTFSGSVSELRINQVPASEFMIHSLAAQSVGVPSIFLSGDLALCEEIAQSHPSMITVPTLEGVGSATISQHPEKSLKALREGAHRAVLGIAQVQSPKFPDSFELEIDYIKPHFAYGRSFYPGAEQVGERTIRLVSNDYFDLLRMIRFAL